MPASDYPIFRISDAAGAAASFGRAAEVTLLTNASVTGAGVAWGGGAALWMIYGTFGGSTATLQLSPDAGTTWIDTNASATAAGGLRVHIPASTLVRVVITGGTGVSLTSKLAGV